MSVGDQLNAEGFHRRVLLAGVPLRHDDHGIDPAGPRGKPDRLTMVASCRRDHAAYVRFVRPQIGHIDQAATDLEGPDRRVVLVLDPDRRSHRLGQQRPDVLRGRRHRGVDDFSGSFDFGFGWQFRHRTIFNTRVSSVKPNYRSIRS